MHTIRVDGNDLFAVYNATKKAREIIVKEKRPALIETISYRVGDHSTSDFSQRYRDDKEMQKWKGLITSVSTPIVRLEKYLLSKGWIQPGDQQKLREEVKIQAREALKVACEVQKPPLDDLFQDVFEKMTPNLEDQRSYLKAHVKKYQNEYDLQNFKDGQKFAQ